MLWGPGVADTDAAANYINVLIGEAIASLRFGTDPTILDLGCGVGGTLFALAESIPESTLHGVTISEQQVELARRFAGQLGLESCCTFHRGDFESIELGVKANVAIAIESMVHAQSMTAFLGRASTHLAPGGTLIIVDDFIASDRDLSATTLRVLDDFRTGWRLSSLTTVPGLVAAAANCGFELTEQRDLSQMIRLRRPRDRVIATIAPVLRPLSGLPLFANLVGGAALTRGLATGILTYQWLRFDR
jgi:cyclopropane fatty-acyl-phospholipid synthase-like methyltransferase